MEILRFTLSGKNAFFKKPEVNSYCYFTYGNIHKIALLGIFGALLGYGGYTQTKDFNKKKSKEKLTETYPEFYERLKDLKISILPADENSKGFISKKIQVFNNSVGYASKEVGGNLIVNEQWLENPKWEICVLIDSEEAEKVKKAICDKKCVYYPYLGKNGHPADIKNVTVENACEFNFEMGRMYCFMPVEKVEYADLDIDDKEELGIVNEFKYVEALPYKMNGWTNQYILQKFLYTNEFVTIKNTQVYQLADKKKIIFY